MNSEQLQRDIQWILDCPDLLEGDATHLRFPTNTASGEDPFVPLSHKVGVYFEALVARMLSHSEDHRLHDSSVQIIREGRTLGELDFIYHDRNGVVTHCEVAIKYYLYYPQDNSIGSHFIGPNPNDTFENKVSRLISHQIPLSAKYYPAAEKRESFVKGIIFYPYDLESPTVNPDHLAADHFRGTWFYQRDISKLADYTQDVYSICKKPNWLSPTLEETAMLSPTEFPDWVARYFSNKRQPLMVSRLQDQRGQWVEQDRLFIVPNQWPHSFK